MIADLGVTGLVVADRFVREIWDGRWVNHLLWSVLFLIILGNCKMGELDLP